jgi:hypothetical protein
MSLEYTGLRQPPAQALLAWERRFENETRLGSQGEATTEGGQALLCPFEARTRCRVGTVPVVADRQPGPFPVER